MMNARSIPMAIAVMMLMIIAVPSAEAGKAFLDDFEDGDYADNNPVTWSRYPAPYDLGTVEIIDGSLVVTPSTEYPRYPGAADYFETDLVVEDRLFHDVNVLTRFRASRSGSVTGFGFSIRIYTDALEGSALWGFLNHPLGDVITLPSRIHSDQSGPQERAGTVPCERRHQYPVCHRRRICKPYRVGRGQAEPDPQLRTRLPLGSWARPSGPGYVVHWQFGTPSTCCFSIC